MDIFGVTEGGNIMNMNCVVVGEKNRQAKEAAKAAANQAKSIQFPSGTKASTGATNPQKPKK